jgi:NADPH2:quinone reductase
VSFCRIRLVPVHEGLPRLAHDLALQHGAGRVIHSEPLAASSVTSNTTGPELVPLLTSVPRFCRQSETGGPEVLKLEDVEVGAPGPGQVRVRHTGIAVNFIDIYFRIGRYPAALPSGLGSDAVGVVEVVGPGVTFLGGGDRVGYMLGPLGAYAEARVMPADVLIRLPDGISDRTASTIIMKGLTAQYLFRQVYPLKAGDTILYHAAAGGVGLIACQWAKAIGVTMIGTVGSDEKAEIARAHGCTHVINYKRENFIERVKEITDGRGVPVVYDSVGKDTFMGSLGGSGWLWS